MREHARNLEGKRIMSEYGPATVQRTYPGAPTGQWGAWFAIVLPDGYAAVRTVTLADGYAETID